MPASLSQVTHRGQADNQIDMACLAALGLQDRLADWKQRCSQDHLEFQQSLASTL